MTKVLHIMNGAVSGGISMTVLNMYRAICESDIKFDCALYNMELGDNGKVLQNMGCSFHQLPLKSKSFFRYTYELVKIIRKEKYNAVHVHYNHTSFYPLFLSLLCGVPIRIAHAHTNQGRNGVWGLLFSNINKFLLDIVSTNQVACSQEAAEAVFGEKCFKKEKLTILKNCIDVDRFKYDSNTRSEVRKELGCEEAFVLGCVGNLGREKNFAFCIEILQVILTKNKNARLVIIGDGKLRFELESTANLLNVRDKVLFLGRKKDVNRYLQGMDVFLMPSLHEGFGIAALEAATSGLPIFISKNMPREFEFYSKCKYLSIGDTANRWANEIVKYEEKNNRDRGADEVIAAGYDFDSNKLMIEKLYM